MAKSAWLMEALATNPGTTFKLGVYPAALVKPGTTGQSLNEGLPLAELGQSSLKFPLRSASVGTGVEEKKPEAGVSSRRHSSDQKKNVFCLFAL